MSEFSKDRTGTGTREWSEESFNIGKGCSHNCAYCYARYNSLVRFKRVATIDEWANEIIKPDALKGKTSIIRRVAKNNGVIMLPTTHDITPTYLETVMKLTDMIVKGGANVLLVSKPHMDCIKEICKEFSSYTNQIMFRFTLGTTDPKVSKLWEPGAPSPEERLECLKYAYERQFQTSVSSEPMLGGRDTAHSLLKACEPWITDTIWFGKMNGIKSRVMSDDPAVQGAAKKVAVLQSDREMLALYNELKDHPRVAWKDSIKTVAGLRTTVQKG